MGRMKNIDKLRRHSGWPIVTRGELERWEANGEWWDPAGHPKYGYQMYWSARSGGVWVKE